ncbi:mechanosensitive ion channel family protein [candidate division KSB1 bacterium]
MENLSSWFSDLAILNNINSVNLVASFVIIIIFILLRKISKRIMFKNVKDTKVRYRWQKIIVYITTILPLIIIALIWFQNVRSIATYFGIISAGLAIALRDIIVNLAAWLFIIWRKPFTVGDRVQVGNYAGDVIDLRIFKFTILEIGNWVNADQSTGRIIDVPNSLVLTDVVANYSKGFSQIWNEIPVLVTFESNWKRAKDILQTIANKDADILSVKQRTKLCQLPANI